MRTARITEALGLSVIWVERRVGLAYSRTQHDRWEQTVGIADMFRRVGEASLPRADLSKRLPRPRDVALSTF